MPVPALTDRVRKNALILHGPDTLAAYVEMEFRYYAYRKALDNDDDSLAKMRRELYEYRRKQNHGKRKGNNEAVSKRSVLAFVDANLYLAWAAEQIGREEALEALEPLCECRLSVVLVRHGRRWCSRCKRFKELADA